MKITDEQKELVLLHIVAGMGGNSDCSESRWSWLNWFCGDEANGQTTDTFNRCIDHGWLLTSHNSDTDAAVVWLTDAGRAAIVAALSEAKR